MPRPVVLDESVLHAWSVRGLLLGLADREPPVIVPFWTPAALEGLRRRIEGALSPRRGPRQATHDASAIVERMASCYPEAAVREGAGLLEAAVIARAPVIVTCVPEEVDAGEATRFGLTVTGPDELLCDLHDEDPWRMLHATMLYAFVLRRPGRTPDDLLAELARSVPVFAGLIRRQMAGLPANQPPEFFPPPPVGDDSAQDGEGWCCVACDPFPCPGHRAPRVSIWGTVATSLHDDECRFVGVSQTAQHRTLVWPADDDPRMLEIAAEMRDQCRNPRLVPYTPAFGPAVSFFEWEATGSRVHGVHDIPPPAA